MGQKEPLRTGCCVLLFLEYFLIFWHKKMFLSYLVLSLPRPQTQLSLQGVLVSFRGGCVQILRSQCSVSSLSQCHCCQSAGGRARECIYVYIHMCILVSVAIYMIQYMSIFKTMNLYLKLHFKFDTSGLIMFFFLCIFIIFFPWL